MGGQIGVESKPGAGSTFWFTVRLLKSGQSVSPRLAPAALQGVRTLAVDDNATNREILREQLTRLGADVQTAGTASEAMELLRIAAGDGRPFQLAVLDRLLPDGDGLDLAAQILAQASFASLRLVLLTSLEQPLPSEEIESRGLCGCLVKPVRQSELATLLTAAMRHEHVAPKRADSRPSVRTENRPAKAKVLLAEDNEINQIVAMEVLARHGFACDAVDTGRKAVELALAGGFDLVLMDCQMPDMDGFQATAAIREAEATRGDGDRLPIIALTANAIKGDRERCLAAGMDGYVSKPIHPTRLVEAIEQVLSVEVPRQDAQAAPAASSPASSFDTRSLIDRCMGDIDLATRVLAQFETRLSGDIKAAEAAMASGSSAETARLLHNLRGASANVSADALAQAAAEIERLIKAADLAAAGSAMAQLRSEADRCLADLPNARAAIARQPSNA